MPKEICKSYLPPRAGDLADASTGSPAVCSLSSSSSEAPDHPKRRSPEWSRVRLPSRSPTRLLSGLTLATFLFPLVSIMLSGALFGCRASSERPADELIFAIGANPVDLDPRMAVDAYSDKISRLLFGALLLRDRHGALQLQLAASLDQPTPLSYRVTLRPDLHFEDGHALTSDDVRYTFESLLDPTTLSPKRASVAALTHIEAPDPLTLVFHLSRPDAPFLEALTLGIVPRHVASRGSQYFQHHLVASGPYRLESFVRDQEVILEANPFAPLLRPSIAHLRLKIIPDATVRALELIHGSIDLIQNDMPAHLLEALGRRPGLKLVSTPSSLVKYLAFNTEDPRLKDPQVRRAVVMGLNLEDVITYRYRGFASKAHSLLAPSTLGFSPDIPEHRFAPELARKLLDNAGLVDPPGPAPRLTLRYRTSLDEVAVAVARIFSSQLRDIGVELKVETHEFGIFFDAIKRGDFQLYSLTAVGVNDPDYYANLMHSGRVPPSGANRGRYRSPQMDRLLDLGRSTSEPADRAEIYRRIQQLAYEDAAYVPLWYEHNVAVMREDVQGYIPTLTGDFTALLPVSKRTRPAP